MGRPSDVVAGQKPCTTPINAIKDDMVSQTDTSDQAIASDVVFATGKKPSSADQSRGMSLMWKDASELALTVLNQAATVDWTVLDLTAYTSANAKLAYLQLKLIVDTANKDYYLAVRKNGTTPTEFPLVRVNQGNANAADVFNGYVMVGLDSNQVIQYRIDVEAGGQCDIQIDVLGYWE